MSSLSTLLSETVGRAFAAEGLDAAFGKVIVSNRPDLAQYQCNGALAAAKSAKRNPREIAYFDRGPMDSTRMVGAGSWSAYWYNGVIVSSEIARGLDVFELAPSAYLTQNEIDAAKTVHFDYMNTQGQPKFVWPASAALARAYADQLERSKGLSGARLSEVRQAVGGGSGTMQNRTALTALAAQLDADASTSSDAAKVRSLAATLRALGSA